MKFSPVQNLKRGFTLIELVVVIGILGVLAAVLVSTIDPLDKINAANDAGAISTITQLGKGNDSFAAQNSNGYSSGMGTFPLNVCTSAGGTASTNGNLFAGAVYDLCAAGESKQSAISAPSTAYTLYYFSSAAANGAWATCTNTGATKCFGAVFGVGPLQSKKYSATPYFVYANGKSCFRAAAPTNANIGALCP